MTTLIDVLADAIQTARNARRDPLPEPVQFPPNGEMHHAHNEAMRYILGRRWSVGSSSTDGICGVMFRRGVIIAKWRHLTEEERDQCDAYLVGRGPYNGRTLTTERPAPHGR